MKVYLTISLDSCMRIKTSVLRWNASVVMFTESFAVWITKIVACFPLIELSMKLVPHIRPGVRSHTFTEYVNVKKFEHIPFGFTIDLFFRNHRSSQDHHKGISAKPRQMAAPHCGARPPWSSYGRQRELNPSGESEATAAPSLCPGARGGAMEPLYVRACCWWAQYCQEENLILRSEHV